MPDPRSAVSSRSVKVYFDGGCRPNPGVMEIAVVVRGVAHVVPAIGQGTSFDAEWRALIHAVEVARSLGLTDFLLLGDAASVVAQANGTAPCRGAARGYRETLLAALPPGARPRVRYIKRTHNLAGIALARLHDR